MAITKDVDERLRSESEFQNRQVLIKEGTRGRFYYLSESAVEHYHTVLKEVAGKRVLVVGCSDGGVTPLARHGADVVGIDISGVAIEKHNAVIEREGLSNTATTMVMNAEAIEFPDASFDLICCAGVLHHLDIERALAAWSAKLKDGGQVVMVEPLAWNPVVALYRWLTPSARTPDEHPLVPRDLRTCRRHFGQVEATGYVMTSLLSLIWAYLPDRKGRKLAWMAALERLDQRLLRIAPFLLFFCWTSVIRLAKPIRGAQLPAGARQQ